MTVSPVVTDIKIEDEFQIFTFRGIQLAAVSTRLDPRQRQRARWMDAFLFRKDDESYLFYQVNFSTVFHLLPGIGHVKKPEERYSSDLRGDAVYCGVMPAKPGRDHCPVRSVSEARRMSLPDVVVIELPQYKIWTFPGAEAVVRRMTVARHASDGSASAATSWPMRQLLNQARAADPAFAEIARPADKPVIAM